LMFGLNQAAVNLEWWKVPQFFGAMALPPLQLEELDSSQKITSLTTAAHLNGACVILSTHTKTFTFYVPRRFAAELVWLINNTGQTARWWDEDYQLVAKTN